MNNILDLKSCPFCGSNAAVIIDDDTGKFGVKCSKCSGMIDANIDTVYDAVNMWNNRIES